MKRYYFLLTLLIALAPSLLSAQTQESYNRASIYPIYMLHPGAKMYNEIYDACLAMPIPDKYNDHRLSVRVVQGMALKAKEKEVLPAVTDFLKKNQVAKRMVAKWFERNKQTGECYTDLIAQRALYSVSAFEMMKARYTITKKPVLPDVDKNLIPNTFVLVNDISYIDKEEKAQVASAVFFIVGSVAEIAGGAASMAGSSTGSNIGDLASSLAQVGNSISDLVAGFTVDITTYLYQLKWNDEIANQFYLNHYCDSTNLSQDKKVAFDRETNLFNLDYIGSYTARSEKTVLRGLYTPEDVFRKVLTRAQDKNIVELQRRYPQFKVTDVVSAVLPHNELEVLIGLKEGVTPKSKYEVLERSIGNDGTIVYSRKAVIQPLPDRIWDNRFMAVEEEAVNANLGATRFKLLSGNINDITPGLLVRELR